MIETIIYGTFIKHLRVFDKIFIYILVPTKIKLNITSPLFIYTFLI